MIETNKNRDEYRSSKSTLFTIENILKKSTIWDAFLYALQFTKTKKKFAEVAKSRASGVYKIRTR